MPRARLAGRNLLAAVAATLTLLGTGTADAQQTDDERRCTGRAAVSAQMQAEACTALNGSCRHSAQNLAIVHFNRGIAYGKTGDFDRAIADFDAAIGISPNHLRAHLNRGNVWRNKGKFDHAIEDYDKAIALAPDFALAFYSRAQANYLAGRIPDALADADKAARLNPGAASAVSLRGLIQEKLGARAAAIADFQRAHALDPRLQQPADGLRRLGAVP